MPAIGAANPPPGDHWQDPSQLIRQLLGEDGLETAYCRQLLTILNQGAEPDRDVPTISTLPRLACEASGGDPFLATPVAAAWQVVRMAAKLFDDVEDGQMNGDAAGSINLATSLLFMASLALGELPARGVSLECVHALNQALNRAMLWACTGQHADLAAARTGPAGVDPDAWLETARAKSGELLAWAAWAGALVAGADRRTLTCYREYGCHLGVLLQVADDFHDVWYPNGGSDLAAGRPTLPVCYALSVVRGAERTRLVALLDRAARGDEVGEAQAREWLTDLGAQAYLLVVARAQYRQALAALQRAGPGLPAGRQLIALLDGVLPALRCTADETTVAAPYSSGIESRRGATE
jgi:geranylgeranyl diphosphate synthase type I